MKDAAPGKGHWGNRGFTVLEALVYASLSLLLLGLATMILGKQQKSAWKSQQVARMRGDGGEAMALVARDLRNMGLKRVLYREAGGALVDTQLSRADYAPADSSSFVHRDGPRFDTLTFIKPALDAADKPIGMDTITLAVDPATGALARRRNRDAPVTVCERVDGLQFQYRVSAARIPMAEEAPPVLAHWQQNPPGTLTLAGNSLLAARAAAGTSAFWLGGSPLALTRKHSYALDMECLGNAALLANADSLTAMICNAAGAPLATRAFLPDLQSRPMRIDFEGIDCADCRVGIRMHLRGGGQLRIQSFRFSDVEQGDGPWVDQPTLAQKKAVRSIRLLLLTRSRGDVFGTNRQALRIANADYAFNDKAGRALIEEHVAVPNNGSRE